MFIIQPVQILYSRIQMFMPQCLTDHFSSSCLLSHICNSDVTCGVILTRFFFSIRSNISWLPLSSWLSIHDTHRSIHKQVILMLQDFDILPDNPQKFKRIITYLGTSCISHFILASFSLSSRSIPLSCDSYNQYL